MAKKTICLASKHKELGCSAPCENINIKCFFLLEVKMVISHSIVHIVKMVMQHPQAASLIQIFFLKKYVAVLSFEIVPVYSFLP